jgi:hypothetical protein
MNKSNRDIMTVRREFKAFLFADKELSFMVMPDSLRKNRQNMDGSFLYLRTNEKIEYNR